MLGARVDLVDADRVRAVVALDRRVHLERAAARKCVGLGGVLLLVERADRRVRAVVADCLAQLAFEREAPTDA